MYIMARQQKVKFVESITFVPTNVIKRMIEELLRGCPEFESQSSVIRVGIVNLYNDRIKGVKRNGITKS